MRIHATYRVLIILLASTICSHGAGWTPEAWSFTNSWSATNAIATNQMYAVHTIDVITQESSTNVIPAVDLSDYSFRGWTTEELSDLDAINGFGEATLVYTSEYDNAYHPFDYRITNVYSNATVLCGTNSFVIDGGTNDLVTSISRTYSGAVVEVQMDVDTLRDYEMYMAVWERARALGTWNTVSNALNMPWHSKGQNVIQGYGSWTNSNLSCVKYWILMNAPSFINTTNSSSTSTNNHDFTSYIQDRGTGYYYRSSIPAWTVSNLMVSCGSPTNYFDSTWIRRPYKYKVPVGYEFGNAVTTTATIIRYPASKWIVITNWYWFVTNGSSNIVVQYGTNFVYSYEQDEIITNEIYRYDGSTTNLTGTNGQVVSAIYTQGFISGYTEFDLGYRPITSMLSRLVLVNGSYSWSSNGIRYQYYHGATHTNYDTYSSMYEDDNYSNSAFWSTSVSTGSYQALLTKNCGTWAESPTQALQDAEFVFQDNSIEHVSSTNTSSDLFIPYNIDYYVTMLLPNVVTGQVSSQLSFSNMPPNSALHTWTQSMDVVVSRPTYTINPVREYIGSFNMYDPGITGVSSVVKGSDLESVLSGDFGIDPNLVVYAFDYEESDTYQISIDSTTLPSDTKATFVFDSDGRTIFQHYDEIDYIGVPRTPKYTPILIRNYAVTNGFKYY